MSVQGIEIARPDKVFFRDFYVAGRLYNDADDVWDELKIGSSLTLVREFENRFDPSAVAIYFQDTKIGYVPRSGNSEIALFLEMEWSNIFECRISRIDPLAHYEKQIHATLRIVRNPQSDCIS